MNKELHNLESYIKQGKSHSDIYISNLVNLSRSTIFERCKRYKEDSSFVRKSIQEENQVYLWAYSIYTEFNKYWSQHNFHPNQRKAIWKIWRYKD